jgi:hypothetical protein
MRCSGEHGDKRRSECNGQQYRGPSARPHRHLALLCQRGLHEHGDKPGYRGDPADIAIGVGNSVDDSLQNLGRRKRVLAAGASVTIGTNGGPYTIGARLFARRGLFRPRRRPRCGNGTRHGDGFPLDAAVRIEAMDRKGLESQAKDGPVWRAEESNACSVIAPAQSMSVSAWMGDAGPAPSLSSP